MWNWGYLYLSLSLVTSDALLWGLEKNREKMRLNYSSKRSLTTFMNTRLSVHSFSVPVTVEISVAVVQE